MELDGSCTLGASGRKSLAASPAGDLEAESHTETSLWRRRLEKRSRGLADSGSREDVQTTGTHGGVIFPQEVVEERKAQLLSLSIDRNGKLTKDWQLSPEEEVLQTPPAGGSFQVSLNRYKRRGGGVVGGSLKTVEEEEEEREEGVRSTLETVKEEEEEEEGVRSTLETVEEEEEERKEGVRSILETVKEEEEEEEEEGEGDQEPLIPVRPSIERGGRGKGGGLPSLSSSSSSHGGSSVSQSESMGENREESICESSTPLISSGDWEGANRRRMLSFLSDSLNESKEQGKGLNSTAWSGGGRAEMSGFDLEPKGGAENKIGRELLRTNSPEEKSGSMMNGWANQPRGRRRALITASSEDESETPNEYSQSSLSLTPSPRKSVTFLMGEGSSSSFSPMTPAPRRGRIGFTYGENSTISLPESLEIGKMGRGRPKKRKASIAISGHQKKNRSLQRSREFLSTTATSEFDQKRVEFEKKIKQQQRKLSSVSLSGSRVKKRRASTIGLSLVSSVQLAATGSPQVGQIRVDSPSSDNERRESKNSQSSERTDEGEGQEGEDDEQWLFTDMDKWMDDEQIQPEDERKRRRHIYRAIVVFSGVVISLLGSLFLSHMVMSLIIFNIMFLVQGIIGTVLSLIVIGGGCWLVFFLKKSYRISPTDKETVEKNQKKGESKGDLKRKEKELKSLYKRYDDTCQRYYRNLDKKKLLDGRADFHSKKALYQEKLQDLDLILKMLNFETRQGFDFSEELKQEMEASNKKAKEYCRDAQAYNRSPHYDAHKVAALRKREEEIKREKEDIEKKKEMEKYGENLDEHSFPEELRKEALVLRSKIQKERHKLVSDWSLEDESIHQAYHEMRHVLQEKKQAVDDQDYRKLLKAMNERMEEMSLGIGKTEKLIEQVDHLCQRVDRRVKGLKNRLKEQFESLPDLGDKRLRLQMIFYDVSLWKNLWEEGAPSLHDEEYELFQKVSELYNRVQRQLSSASTEEIQVAILEKEYRELREKKESEGLKKQVDLGGKQSRGMQVLQDIYYVTERLLGLSHKDMMRFMEGDQGDVWKEEVQKWRNEQRNQGVFITELIRDLGGDLHTLHSSLGEEDALDDVKLAGESILEKVKSGEVHFMVWSALMIEEFDKFLSIELFYNGELDCYSAVAEKGPPFQDELVRRPHLIAVGSHVEDCRKKDVEGDLRLMWKSLERFKKRESLHPTLGRGVKGYLYKEREEAIVKKINRFNEKMVSLQESVQEGEVEELGPLLKALEKCLNGREEVLRHQIHILILDIQNFLKNCSTGCLALSVSQDVPSFHTKLDQGQRALKQRLVLGDQGMEGTLLDIENDMGSYAPRSLSVEIDRLLIDLKEQERLLWAEEKVRENRVALSAKEIAAVEKLQADCFQLQKDIQEERELAENYFQMEKMLKLYAMSDSFYFVSILGKKRELEEEFQRLSEDKFENLDRDRERLYRNFQNMVMELDVYKKQLEEVRDTFENDERVERKSFDFFSSSCQNQQERELLPHLWYTGEEPEGDWVKNLIGYEKGLAERWDQLYLRQKELELKVDAMLLESVVYRKDIWGIKEKDRVHEKTHNEAVLKGEIAETSFIEGEPPQGEYLGDIKGLLRQTVSQNPELLNSFFMDYDDLSQQDNGEDTEKKIWKFFWDQEEKERERREVESYYKKKTWSMEKVYGKSWGWSMWVSIEAYILLKSMNEDSWHSDEILELKRRFEYLSMVWKERKELKGGVFFQLRERLQKNYLLLLHARKKQDDDTWEKELDILSKVEKSFEDDEYRKAVSQLKKNFQVEGSMLFWGIPKEKFVQIINKISLLEGRRGRGEDDFEKACQSLRKDLNVLKQSMESLENKAKETVLAEFCQDLEDSLCYKERGKKEKYAKGVNLVRRMSEKLQRAFESGGEEAVFGVAISLFDQLSLGGEMGAVTLAPFQENLQEFAMLMGFIVAGKHREELNNGLEKMKEKSEEGGEKQAKSLGEFSNYASFSLSLACKLQSFLIHWSERFLLFYTQRFYGELLRRLNGVRSLMPESEDHEVIDEIVDYLKQYNMKETNIISITHFYQKIKAMLTNLEQVCPTEQTKTIVRYVEDFIESFVHQTLDYDKKSDWNNAVSRKHFFNMMDEAMIKLETYGRSERGREVFSRKAFIVTLPGFVTGRSA